MYGDVPRSIASGNANMQPDPRSYEVVVAATCDMGIGKDEKLPWRLPSDVLTLIFRGAYIYHIKSREKNAVVMVAKNVVMRGKHSTSFGIIG
ncbi:hypothetical protein GH714_000001 [Hevea brasiliensis]|uniref:Dihydrofolate reductase n=1 Tax=Hevea brasiliensis TaxID=3981 RepID=A0A6A6KWA3_HEVBR|nr:hypothetical protein GH714_000001 [Hevea brasiliensis]